MQTLQDNFEFQKHRIDTVNEVLSATETKLDQYQALIES